MQQLKLLEAGRLDLIRALPATVEVAQTADRYVFRGVASSIGTVDRMRRCFLPGAFGTAPVKVPLLAFHDDTRPVGSSVLTPKGDLLTHESTLANVKGSGDFQELMRSGGIPATSIGWLTPDGDRYFGWAQLERRAPELAKRAAAAGITQADDIVYYATAEICENSLVPVPANPMALLSAASLFGGVERGMLDEMMAIAAGARHSTRDQGHIQQAHDHLVACGAECAQTPLEPGDTLPAADTPGARGVGDSGVRGGWQQHMRSSVTGTQVAQGANELVSTLDDVIDQALEALQQGNTDEALSQLQAADSTVDDLMEALNIPDPDEDEAALRILEGAAAESAGAINDLPDSDFAYIEPGGEKDSDGKTTPRSLRHFPIHDEAHVRNALARAPQSPFGEKAMPKILAAAKKFGIDMTGGQSSALPATSEFDEIERELAELAVRF